MSFIYYFILFYAVNPPTPESMLFVVKETLESKIQHWFWGEGREYAGGGDRYVHCSKRGHFKEVSQHFCPSSLHQLALLYDGQQRNHTKVSA